MEVTKNKEGCIFVVSDVGGTPIMSVPDISSEELNILTTMTSVIDSITSVIYDEGFSVGTIDTTHRRLLYIKRKHLVFLLLVPKNIDVNVASSTLRELAQKFINLFGEDPDDVRGVLLFDYETVDSFQKDVINALMDIIREMAPEHLDVFLEELFALLKSRGIEVSRVSTKFVPVNVPFATTKAREKKCKDQQMQKLLELCNGRRTVQEIAEQLGVPTSHVYRMLAKLQKKGLIDWKVVYRLKG